jgi:hypothetical protein
MDLGLIFDCVCIECCIHQSSPGLYQVVMSDGPANPLQALMNAGMKAYAKGLADEGRSKKPRTPRKGGGDDSDSESLGGGKSDNILEELSSELKDLLVNSSTPPHV